MPLNHAFDAEYPPDIAPAHCVAVMGYVSGAHAARIWTLEEWLRFSHLRQFPITVPDMNEAPVPQADEAVRAVMALRWRHGRAIIGDVETSANPAWWAAFERRIRQHFFIPVIYGSLSTVLANRPEIAIVAAWDGIPDIAPEAMVEGEQYAADVPFGGTKIDLSVITDSLLMHGGVSSR
jgi:hypothetical protein